VKGNVNEGYWLFNSKHILKK